MNTDSVAHHDNASENDASEHGFFVTKRTFELLEQEEPFLEKQLRILTATGSEHLGTLKDNLREVVEPMVNEAELCVDCVKDIIRLNWVPQFVGRQRIMVGPASQALIPTSPNFTSSTNALKNSKNQQDQLLSYKSESIVEKPKKSTVGMMKKGKQGSAHTSTISSDTSRSIDNDSNPSNISRHSKLILQKMIPGRETSGILKNRLMCRSQHKTVFEKCVEAESRKKKTQEESRQEEEYKSITRGHVFLVPISATYSIDKHLPSGNRPESPIKLFSSKEFDNDEFIDDKSHLQTHEEGFTNACVTVSAERPFEYEPERYHTSLKADPGAQAEKEGSTSIREPLRDRPLSDAEQRDPPPEAGLSPCDNESTTSVSPRQFLSSVDFSSIKTISGDCRFPCRRSLLYSMRSQNRKLDELAEQLKQVSSRYTFGTSGEDMTTDHSATLSSRGSSFIGYSSDHRRAFELSKHSAFLSDETSLEVSSVANTNGDSSIANSSIDTDGEREGSQSTFLEEFISSTGEATISVHAPKQDLQVTSLYRKRPFLGPRFRSKSVYSKNY